LSSMERTDQSEVKRHGLTSWLRVQFAGKEKESRFMDTQFLNALVGLKKVGRYEIVRKLGEGSMGVVYLGKDPYIKRDVAIKISRLASNLRAQREDDYRKRFFTEAQSAGRLIHENIVAIYDAGIDEELYYMAMEYVDGSTMEKFCRKENLLPIHKVVEMIFSACNGLDYAHKKGVIHRDIKPSNMMLNKLERVKITDFGIAHIKTEHNSQKGIIGSPCYMSPEQVKEEPVEDKSDIFSLGCVLYELLTGEKAFYGDNHFSVLYKITHDEPESMLKIRPEVPEILDQITRKALSKDPTQRYQSCLDMAYDLRVALRGLSGTVKKSKMEDVVDYVHNVPFFENFTRDQVREIVMASDLIKVPKGKVLVSEGEIDDSFFILLSGKAAVRKVNHLVAVIHKGECFGEMSYLSGQSRAATVIADADCVLLKMSATLLDRSSESMQLLFLKQFALTLMARLAKSNEKEQ